MQLTADFVRSVLDYDPESGIFHWKFRPLIDYGFDRLSRTWNTRFAGRIAGCNRGDYIVISLKKKTYLAHRLAFLVMSGKWPTHDIDHRDLDKTNNQWSNLREATKTQNSMNRGPRSTNTSGFKGVDYLPKRNKWRARITNSGRKLHLGYFDSADLAALAYSEATKELNGEFGRVAHAARFLQLEVFL